MASVKDLFEKLEEAAIEVGLKVNEEKTKFLQQSRGQQNRIGQDLAVGDRRFETVKDFTYLGFNVADDNDEMKEVQKRLSMGSRTFFSLLKIFKSRNVHRNIKVRLYKTIIRTVATYGCEVWTLTSRAANILDRWERKMLRRIYGAVREERGWRIRNNDELAQLYKEPPLSIYIRLKRLKWAGHVERMPDSRIPKKMYGGQPGGKRPVGKPRLRWMDAVAGDARDILHVRNWKLEARNRDGWRGRIEEARARFGL